MPHCTGRVAACLATGPPGAEAGGEVDERSLVNSQLLKNEKRRILRTWADLEDESQGFSYIG